MAGLNLSPEYVYGILKNVFTFLDLLGLFKTVSHRRQRHYHMLGNYCFESQLYKQEF